MIDKEIIESKIDIILKNLHYLGEVRAFSKKEFLESFQRLQASKHCLQESIEASLDIANHLIAGNGWERAETYADMFHILHNHHLIDKNLLEKLTDMARFRNLLVHRYGTFDDERFWTIIQEDIDDISEFVKKIELYLLDISSQK